MSRPFRLPCLIFACNGALTALRASGVCARNAILEDASRQEIPIWGNLSNASCKGRSPDAARPGASDAGPSVRPEVSPHVLDVLGEGIGGALREVEQKLPPLPEDPAQEARHGEDNVTMRDGLEHFLLQPFGPQELFLLFA